MSDKHILLVDDDKFILTFLEHTIKKLEPNCQVVMVMTGPEAVEQLQQQQFDLLITDYLMPGLSGIDLANAARYISPDTAVVLMTAHATEQLSHTIELLNVNAYIRKPINLAQVRKVVVETLGEPDAPEPLAPATQQELEKEINQRLQTLRVNTGARFIVLTTLGGGVVQEVGAVNKEEAHQIAMLTAANYQANRQLVHLVDSQPVYRSSSLESQDYDIYTYDINDDFLLAVVFGKEIRAGVIWVYTKQAADALIPLVSQLVADEFDEVISVKLALRLY